MRSRKTLVVMNKTPIILLIAVVIICSCSESPSATIKEVYKDGSTKVTYTYFDSADTTSYIRHFFHPNGVLGHKGKIINGKQDGLWQWWFENGNRKDLAYCDNGLYIKHRKHWREDGTLKQVEIIDGYCEGECCDGVLIYYDNDGLKLLQYTMKNGNYDGIGYGYYKDGSIKRKFYYKNGLKNGMNYEYLPNGNISVSGMYKDDLEQGKWSFRDNSGKIISYSYYIDGEEIKSEFAYH